MAEKGKIGIQFSTIRPALETMGLYELLKACAELGYSCIEISQVPMTADNVAIFKRAQDEFGMEVAAINAGIESIRPGMECLEKDYDKIVRDCRTLNCNMLRIGSGPIFDLHSRQDVLDYCRKVDVYADRLKNDGIDYYYHNHAFEFQRFEGETMLDTLRLNSHIGFELDIHWIHVGGEDPVQVINRFAGRIRLLHLKDYRMVYPKIDVDAMRKQGINPQYLGIQFAEIGEGTLNIRGAIEAGLQGGSEYFLIEQDRTYDRTPLEALRISRDNLVAMGYKDWF